MNAASYSLRETTPSARLSAVAAEIDARLDDLRVVALVLSALGVAHDEASSAKPRTEMTLMVDSFTRPIFSGRPGRDRLLPG